MGLVLFAHSGAVALSHHRTERGSVSGHLVSDMASTAD